MHDMHEHEFEHDARLDALLDEVLGAESIDGGIPSDLNSRILAALPLHELRADAANQPAVVGRIGFFAGSTFRRVAAAVLVAVGIGAAIISLNSVPETSNQAEQARLAAIKETAEKNLLALKTEIEQAPVTVLAARSHNDATSFSESTIDNRIDSLKSRTSTAALTAAVDNWSNVTQSLEDALDALEAEPDNG